MADPSESESDDSKGKRRGGGGRLSRSETVTVRLDPKLRYLAELAARKQRRTLSSFIEWAIEENLKNLYLEERDDAPSIASQAANLWDVDEPDRFAKLAFRYPQMLTHDEQVLWKLVRENSHFWSIDDPAFEINERSLRFDRLRQTWSKLKQVVQGDLPKSVLLDDDIRA
jgi:hypothetical protein